MLSSTNLFVILSVLIFSRTGAQRRCTTPNGENAQCVSIRSCPILFNALTTRNRQQLFFLRESQCGLYGRDPLVCCGSYDNYKKTTTEETFINDEPYGWGSTSGRRTTSRPSWDNSEERTSWGTPTRRTTSNWGASEEDNWSSNNNNNRRVTRPENGNRRVTKPENGNRRRQEFENKSGERGTPSWGSNRDTSNRRGSSGSKSNIPDRSSCGFQEVDRILNGQVTSLREFPWMALLQYRKKSGNLVFSCGGTLISSRHVLTAAHCVKGQILTKVGPLVNVRLGEYNTETEQDCSNQLGFEICNDKPIDSEIDKITVHPSYNEASDNRYNDIALVKLKREAPNTDFIRPICLPSRSEKSNVGERLVVAGWGRTEYSNSSPVKLKLWVPVVASSQCSTRFRSAGVTLGNKQLCAGGERGKDSCNGDSGGPLMATTKNDSAQWYIEGIVSFGAKCGSEGWPGIYTKVSEYVDWINDNLN